MVLTNSFFTNGIHGIWLILANNISHIPIFLLVNHYTAITIIVN